MGTVSDRNECCKGRNGVQRCYPVIKRGLDILLSAAALLLLAVPMLLIAALIHVFDGRPVIYRQIRLGRGGRKIRLLKFRSMCPDAENQLSTLPQELQEQYRREYKIEVDPRVTRLGSFLRRTSLDELPQLWNVLKGELSLIGPRPVLPDEIGYYQPEEQELFLSVRPGLSGYWQACARPEDTYTSGKRQKMELYYAAHLSAGLDLKIFLRTFATVIRKAVKK